MPAKLLVSIDSGSSYLSGGLTLTPPCTVQIRMQSTVGVQTQRYELYGYPPGFVPPSGWTLDSRTQAYVSSALVPPAFTIPSVTASNFGKYLLRLTVNGGMSKNAAGQDVPDPAMVDDTTAISVEYNGFRDVIAREGAQFGGPIETWVHDLRHNFRALVGAGITTTPSFTSVAVGGLSALGTETGRGQAEVFLGGQTNRAMALAAGSSSGSYTSQLYFESGAHRAFAQFTFDAANAELTGLNVGNLRLFASDLKTSGNGAVLGLFGGGTDDAAAAGGNVEVTAGDGGTAGGNVVLQPGQSDGPGGQIRLKNAGGATRFMVDDTGIAFFNTPCAARPTVASAVTNPSGGYDLTREASTVTLLNQLRAALVAYGLVT